ncbi:P-loop containing nucleoside triphosphate hydrolase protein [Coprinopsis sp. MPI-PUGE-AT-0042]|nr:P-loop containing nucleoside triphosphate hydrolase protein [Coprinopsis sp. MPI-PUGE-AT-0042]
MSLSEIYEVSSQNVEEALCKAFKVDKLRPFQLKHALDLVEGRDVFLAVATGQGKTVVLLAPLVVAMKREEDGIGILIVPTKALAEQQETTATKIGIKAFALTEDTVRDAKIKHIDLFRQVASLLGIRLAIMSPQMLQGERFNSWLKERSTRAQIRWFLIDEAHLAREEAGPFHRPYKGIGVYRTRVRPETVWCAVTGTITQPATTTASNRLGFRKGAFVNARYPLDRPNITYAPRFFQHAVSGSEFFDLSFLIPLQMKSPAEITPTLVFVKTIATSQAIMSFLDTLIPSTVPNRSQIIKLYNSTLPLDYRLKFIKDISSGSTLRIGIVTDALTYGLDIPGLSRVVIFDLCDSFEQMKQQTGRVGRNGQPARAIVFAPSWVRDLPAESVTNQKTRDDIKRREVLPQALRNWFNPPPWACPCAVERVYNGEGTGITVVCHCTHSKGLDEEERDLKLVAAWKEQFQAQRVANDKPKLPQSDRTYKALDATMKASLQRMLEAWRNATWARVQDHAIAAGYCPRNAKNLPCGYFLLDHELKYLVDHVHICTTLDRLKLVMAGWRFLDHYGVDLLAYLTEILDGFTDIYYERTSKDTPIASSSHASKNLTLPASIPFRVISQPQNHEDEPRASATETSRDVSLDVESGKRSRAFTVTDSRKDKRARVKKVSKGNKENKPI